MICRFCGYEMQSELINDDRAKRFFCTCDQFKKEQLLVTRKRELEAELSNIDKELYVLRLKGCAADEYSVYVETMLKRYNIHINPELQLNQGLIDYGF